MILWCRIIVPNQMANPRSHGFEIFDSNLRSSCGPGEVVWFQSSAFDWGAFIFGEAVEAIAEAVCRLAAVNEALI